MKNSPNKLCTLVFSEFLDSFSLHLSLEVEAIEASSQSWADDRSMGTLLVSSSAMATSVDDGVGSGGGVEDALAGSSSSSTTVPSSAKFNTRRKGDILQYQ